MLKKSFSGVLTYLLENVFLLQSNTEPPMILAYCPSLDRDVDLTRLSELEAEALRRDMAGPLWCNAAPGIKRVVEAALNH